VKTINFYPLSSPQREIWFDQVLHPELPLYNVGGYVQINGAIDPALFESAVNLLVKRHEALRTVVAPDPEEMPMQTFLEDLAVTVPVHDFSREKNPRFSALAWMQQQFVQPFALYEKPLFHFALLKIDSHCFFWFKKYHHLIVDGWGISLITQSLAEIYTHLSISPDTGLIQDQKIEGAAPSYLAFVNNDRAYIESKRYQEQRQYWLEKYRTLPEPLFTPRYLSRFVERMPPSEHRVISLARPLYNRLLALAKHCKATIFHLILGTLYVYFTRTAQIGELVVGLPVLNRSGAAFKGTVGLFVGVSAARLPFGTDLSFKTLLQRIGGELKQNYRYQRFPISELNREIGLRQVGRKQLFDISLSYLKNDYDVSFASQIIQAKALWHNYEQTPLMIYVSEFHADEDVDIDWVYNLAYFDAPEVERIQSRFVQILEYVINHVDESIGTIPLLTEAEQQQLLAWNQSPVSGLTYSQTILDLFQAQVEKTPDHIAVVFEEEALSYGELNIKANQLAHYLQMLGVGAETLVGICIQRSLEMVIGLMGILKAGGAYVPLDPDYPLSRLRFMVADSKVKVFLSQSHLLDRLSVSTAKKVCLDSEWELIASGSGKNPVRQSGPENLAYVLFTSGSTGKPKGVMIEHKSATTLIQWAGETFPQEHLAGVLASTSICFDLSVYELFVPLCLGGRIFVVENALSLPTTLAKSEAITLINTVPSAIAELLRTQGIPNSVKVVNLAGEPLKNRLAQTLYQIETIDRVYNLYGPSEDTTYSTFSLITKGSDREVNIGRPIANTRINILDVNHNLMPPGIPGELCIAGAGLSRGYLNRPELTAEKFDQDLWDYQDYYDEKKRDNEKFLGVQGPFFKKVPGRRRLYRTGDLGRWLPDGNIDFLGRLDHQVKLRGFRIELSEIEVTLSRHEAVKEAVVVLYNQEDNPRLTAYITLASPLNPVAEVLRTWLKTRLPEYMLPASFMVLDRLPLTPNGKIDRKALPAPDLSLQAKHQVPRTETEHLLCSLWSQVLGIEVTSIHSHFFAAGGHSLLATRLVSRIRESFGIEMPLRVVFDQALLREQAEWLDKQHRGPELPPIMPLAEGEPLVLSFAQQRLWFLAQLEGQSATYNMPAALHLEGQLDETALQRALTTLIQRHHSLRLCFPMKNGEPAIQLNDVYNPLSVTDLSELPETEQQCQVREWITNHAQAPFDLGTGPLLRLRLLKLDKQDHVLLFNIHHIISDGWSMGVLTREWRQLYNSYAQNRVPRLSSLSIQYTDYAAWQKNWLSGEVLEQQLAYWLEKLAGAPQLLELPTDYPRPAVMLYQGKHLQSTLGQELTPGIKQLSRQQGVTVFMMLLAAFKVLLSRYSGQTDVVVGSPVANRTHRQTEDMIGFFVNTLVLRTQVNGEQTFPELLKQVRETALEAYSHQDIPFEYLVEQLNPVRSLSHSPLFQVIFVLQNAPEETLEFSGLKVSFLEPEFTTAKFDLILSIAEQEGAFVCDWEYRTDLFRSGTITRMTEHFRVLLEGILNQEQPLSQLPLLSEVEQQQLLAWNQRLSKYPENQAIVDLFQAQAKKTPDNIAIIFEDQELSYQELNTRANRLAHYLMTLGVGAGTLVGICVERSLEMVIGLLGILKAGGAYVPLDPDYPLSRLRFMLEDSFAPVLVSQSHLLERLPISAVETVCLDSRWEAIAAGSGENPVRQSGPEDLAYVIYTSGSTGKPKGVLGIHRGMVNRLNWGWETTPIEPDEICCHRSSINFLDHAAELFCPLFKGVSLVLLSKENMRDVTGIINVLYRYKIRRIVLVPSLLAMILAQGDQVLQKLASVKYWFCSGEELPVDQVKLFYERLPGGCLFNIYGSSEVSADAAAYRVECRDTQSVPIGKPLSNTYIYILDKYLEIVPVGIPGELYVGGVGLARGYLNRPELTAEKFDQDLWDNQDYHDEKKRDNEKFLGVQGPFFKKVPGRRRLYKTGDLARWLPDGNIEYLGRIDRQVQLRGFRIELSEIEAALTRHEAVKEAVVVLYDKEANPGLAAYVTLVSLLPPVSGILRTWLKTSLPEYMLPSSFTVLDNLPLTPSGKIDRKALPAPDSVIQVEHQAPRTETEQLLCTLWSHVLGKGVTSILSNFFEAGGHSLLATQLVSRIRESFRIEMPLQVIFERPLLQEQAQWLDNRQRGPELPPISPLAEGEPLVLSFAQQRLWFLAQLEGQSATYNMPAALHLEGQLDETALQRALIDLIQRHHSLRLCFPAVDGEATIQLLDVYNPLSVTDLNEFPESEQQCQVKEWITNHVQTPFDLGTGPLLSLRLLKLGKQEQVLLFNIHHIISDGWSMGVLIREWSQLYSAYAQNRAYCQPGHRVQLASLPIQYTDYAAWQKNWLQGEVLERQLAYWREKLSGAPELLELPTDYLRPALMLYQGKLLQCTLNQELTQGIKQFSQQQGVTVFMMLLAVFKVLLSRYSRQTDLVVGSPIANRTHQQTEDLIGFFVNTLVLRSRINGEQTFRELLIQVRQTALEAYSHQDIPFEYLVEQVNPSRSLSYSPLFQVMFVLQNAPQQALELSSLKMSFLEPEFTAAKFDLTLSIGEQDGVFVCDWEYRTDLFRPDTVTRMTEHFRVLLEGILDPVYRPISQLPLLTEADQQQLQAWNQSPVSGLTYSQTILDLFQAQVEKTPDYIAVVFEDQQLSYQELNIKANRLAHYLLTLGVSTETLVGICIERSLDMVIGLLGILKAGGVYVPFDPDYLSSRLRFMLEDSKVKLVLSQSHLQERLPVSSEKTVYLESLWEQIATGFNENPLRQSRSENLAYVIYTSGSTGVPKGVMVTHNGFLNLTLFQKEFFNITTESHIMQFASFSFDAACWELSMTIPHGGQFHLASVEKLLPANTLVRLLNERRITHITLPPSALAVLPQDTLPHLQFLVVAGEACSPELVTKWSRGRKFINAYGPTESTVCASLTECQADGNPPPIGKPIANTQIHILDVYHNPTPPGIPGELCIAGTGLARGYLNRPELTAEKFISAPASSSNSSSSWGLRLAACGCRIYKTGDLARWLPDGNIEFLGRLDYQVKLRGFRIELPEIEVALIRHEAVKEAVVVLYDKEDNPRLIAYVTLASPLGPVSGLTVGEVSGVLCTWLKTSLPEYMVPASITVLDKLPLTPNGKIDRKALPTPDLSIRAEQQAPRTETQHLLCSLWSQVLGREVTSIRSDFFAAGGHSLLATQLVSRIRESFGIEMPLQVIFERPLLQEQAEWLDHRHRGLELPPIMPLSEGEPLVLSFAQQRLWFLAQLEGQSTTYNISAALHLEGQLDETALQQALTVLIRRHHSLRLCFPMKDGEAAIQLNDVYNPLSVTDLSKLPETEQQRQVKEWITNQTQTPFDLGTGPLLRLHLLKLGKQEQVLLFTMHHIICDGWSIGALIREWSLLYNAYAQNRLNGQPGHRIRLSALPIQYTDYAAWQRSWLQGEVLERQLAYWKEKLAGAPELLELPTDYPRPAIMLYQGKHMQSTLGQELTRGIKQLSRQQGMTVFMTLLAAFKVLLSRYSGQTDLVVGSPIANRTHQQTEDLIGFFVNTLVLRTQIKGEQTFSALLKQVRQTALEAYSHQDIPFEYLVEQLNPSRSLSHSPLFQVMFALQNAPEETLELSGLKVTFLEPENTAAKFDLTLSITEQGGVFFCDWEYRTDLFRPGTITRMAEHFRVLLEGILDPVYQSISQLPMLTEVEQQQLLAWNQTDTEYHKDETIVDLFQAQVEKTPDHIAVVFEDQHLNCQELNTRANRLAHYLMKLAVSTETLVGICVERSLEMIIGLLGILKAGGVYVPLDPDYPLLRLRFMLEDSGVKVLLSQGHLLERLPVSTAKAVYLDSRWETIAAGSGENPVRQSGPGNLAYVIYTSGSTGKPKGVMIEHTALSNFNHSVVRSTLISHEDIVLQFASINFDAAVEEIYPILTQGGRLILRDRGILDTDQTFLQICQQMGVTILDLPTAYWQQLITEPVNQNLWPESVRLVIIGGEAASRHHVKYWQQNLSKNVRLLNTYGPTEATVVASSCWLTEFVENLPIGTPIPNTKILILDTHFNPTPPGIPGELCITGTGLARGYLNRPELTSKKFISAPASSSNSSSSWGLRLAACGCRIYKTGDLGRWLPDGNIEFLGRLDHQVKLRGFRIELPEIEAALTRHEAVKEAAVVLYNQEDNPRLAAYITLASPPDPVSGLTSNDVAAVLLTWLKTRLPEYMLPASFTVLEKLPLTHSGKIDRKALPAPDLVFQAKQQLPRTETEFLLCSLWSQVLGVEVTSIHSHFFAAGGHSLLATRLVSRIRESFGIEMPLQVIFERPLLREQAQWLDNRRRGPELPPIMPLAEDDPFVLSFAQQRLWFLAQLEGQSATYNMPAALHLEGKLDEIALQRVLTALIQRHHSLRLCFPKVDGEATVKLNDVYNPLSITDLSELPEREQQRQVTGWIINHAQIPFDLGTGPLLSLRLLKLDKQEQVLLFNMHHIISDGWSMGVLIREWSRFYNAYAQNHAPSLPPLPIQYTDYAAWQRNWLQGEVLERQLAYWREKLSGAPQLLELPTDYPRPAVMRYQGKHLQSTLNQVLTRGIKQFSRQQGVTVFMTLLAAFKVLLSRYSGQTDLMVGTPVANRTHRQTEDLIGFFVNTLVLRTQINGEQTFSGLLKQVRQTALEAYSHQDIPFEYLVEQINPSRNLSHSPLFQVMLALQNAPEQALELSCLKVSFLKPENTAAKFDLTLSIAEQGDVFVCNWEYNTDLFRPETITRITEHFQILLEGILNPEQSISQLPLLTEADQQQLLAWNQMENRYPGDETIVDLFQAQVEKAPDHIALVFEDQQLSYRELNARANRLAHYLMTLGVGAETLAGLCVQRSLEMVIGLLAILKAGGAYVPLDPDYPLSRLQFMLEDSFVPVLLSQGHLLERLPVSTMKAVCLDTRREAAAAGSSENPLRQSGPGNLAYVIYTSGSTGVPKGVMVRHIGLTNLIQVQIQVFNISRESRLLQFASISFDASVSEIATALTSGAALQLGWTAKFLPDGQFIKLMDRQLITHVTLPPSFLAALPQEKLSGLETMVVAGEACSWEIVTQWSNGRTFINAYGPTESTVCAALTECQADGNPPSIGKPIANTQIYILDIYHNPTPPGIPGELYIAGAGLARGYLNRPELTAKKFISAPASSSNSSSSWGLRLAACGCRIYKTGDLGRWLPDGNIEFLGRLDHQVKLRGFRIELPEIESALSRYEAVKEAVVELYTKEDNPRLAAYVTLTTAVDDVSGVLRRWLKTRLPEYMLPASFTVLDKLPLTPNGKIDRKALPAPDLAAFTMTYAAPRTDEEHHLVEVWNQVLKQTGIGIFDNFFERGGDSILSIQIVARARAIGLKLSPRDLFQHQTIAELAKVVQPLFDSDIETGPVTGEVPLTPIQQAFFNRQPKEPWHFNQAVLLTVPADIDEAALRQALAMILQHHDALRLRYRQVDGRWQQWYEAVSTGELPFHSEDLGHLLQAQVLRERADFWQASLNLETGPLVRFVLFHLGSESRLLWCIHHLAVDGVSWRILLEDLRTAYYQAAAGRPIRLPAKTSSFKTWAEHLFKWEESESFAAQAGYWRTLAPAAPLPIDNPASSNRIVDSQHYTVCLTPDTTQRLLNQVPVAYRTQINDLLLTALMLTLRDWTGAAHHLIDLESHGRADLFEEINLSRTVGWFTSLHTLSLQLPAETDLGTALKTIKEQLRNVPHEGVGYGVLRCLCRENLPQGQILFNYLGQFDQVVRESDFGFAVEDSGRAFSLLGERQHLMEINGQITNGCLCLTWSYSGKQYRRQTIQELADNYQQQLQQLIEHCTTSYGYTPSDFPLAALEQTQLDQLAQHYGNNIADIYPLSPMQQGMLFHSLHAPGSGIYFEQLHFCLNSQLNIEAFCQAWQHLIYRHTILRTAFWHETDTPLQIVCKRAELSWQTFDWHELPEAECQRQLQCLLTTERSQGFELTQAPLMRVQVIRESDFKWRLVWHHHHLLMDGWCLPILLRELFEGYQAFTKGQIPRLPPIRPYREYIAWLSRQNQEIAKVYWQEQLEGFTAPTPLPMALYWEGQAHYQELALTLEVELTQQLKHFGRQHRLTLNTLVQGAWAALLSRYSGESDVVFGTTTSGRHVPITGIDRMLGLFINTLPLRVQVENNDIISVLQTIQQRQQQNNQYAYTALGDIQNWSEVPNGIALFDTIVVFENYPLDEKLEDKQHRGLLEISDLQAIEYTNYPITLAVMPGQEFQFKLAYDSHRFPKESMERMLAHLNLLLEGLVAQPGQSWHQLPLLTKTEQQQLLAWNQSPVSGLMYSKTILDLFQVQVEKTPDHIAVVFEDQQLCYQELNTRANQLAHCLMTLGVGCETLVGICVERSLEMVTGLLGILKAGGAYVPLDPDYPLSRLRFMLEDSRVKVLLSQSHLLERLPVSTMKVVCLDSRWEPVAVGSGENPVRQSGPGNPAYVIYTSGSTGMPKGVIVRHIGLTNLIQVQIQAFNISRESRLLQFASISFDASVSEIATALSSGAALQLGWSGKFLPDEQFIKLMDRQLITHVTLPPSFLAALPLEKLSSLKTMVAAGEACSRELVTRWSNGRTFINAYGPTESTVCASLTECQADGKTPPIGKPIANTQIYILDIYHNPTPPGIPGELYIAGAGLARGYLNRPELTSKKFDQDLWDYQDYHDEKKKNYEKFLRGSRGWFFQKEPPGRRRLYKTGDLGRWLPDGNIEFLGRLDHQVKLRGFRIELPEIEAALTRHEAVKEAVVELYTKEDNPRLAAYVTLTTAVGDVSGVLRRWLKTRLPEYMLPASFTVLDKLPLTPNGKIDRKALPAPGACEIGKHYRAPRDTVELQLAQIWENLLEVHPVGINDNFFELGGHSLLAVKLMSRIQHVFERHLPMATLFQGKTIAELASVIRQHDITWPTLIPIQPQGCCSPLFCLPGAGGNVLYFHSLAAHLGKDQPCYGLQPPGLDGKNAALDTIEVLAADHLGEIQKVQPRGPFYLAGHSFGGKVAYELARQLEQRGETVALLAVLDSPPPASQRKEDHTNWTETDWLRAIVEILEELFETEIGLTKETLQCQAAPEQSFELVMQHLKQRDIFFTPGAESGQFKAMVDVFKANVHANTHYQPQGRINAPIVLFRAREQPQDLVQSEDLDWSPYTAEKVTVEWTPGTHFTMFSEPHVKQLAAQLKSYLHAMTGTI
jgi:amino acid adenylation domain-containing protein/non-ribosomal peptide synthase protein (TIGR01720 family)